MLQWWKVNFQKAVGEVEACLKVIHESDYGIKYDYNLSDFAKDYVALAGYRYGSGASRKKRYWDWSVILFVPDDHTTTSVVCSQYFLDNQFRQVNGIGMVKYVGCAGNINLQIACVYLV